jgi:HEPN domain-containing protein
MEKMLKACLCKNLGKTPPKVHNLLNLADMAGIKLDNSQKVVLTEINEFNLEGRYPLDFVRPLDKDGALKSLKKAREAFECFRQIL